MTQAITKFLVDQGIAVILLLCVLFVIYTFGRAVMIKIFGNHKQKGVVPEYLEQNQTLVDSIVQTNTENTTILKDSIVLQKESNSLSKRQSQAIKKLSDQIVATADTPEIAVELRKFTAQIERILFQVE